MTEIEREDAEYEVAYNEGYTLGSKFNALTNMYVERVGLRDVRLDAFYDALFDSATVEINSQEFLEEVRLALS